MLKPISTAALAGILLSSTTAMALDPAATCEASKLGRSAQYASCRLKADSKAAKAGTMADYSKCSLAKFADAETKATDAGGSCPTTSDQTTVEDYLDDCTSTASLWLAGGGGLPDTCDSDLLACEGDLSTTNADASACTGSLATCTSDLSSTNADLGSCNTNLSATNADLGACTGRLGTCNSELAATNAGLGACNADLSATNADLSATNADLASCNNALAACQSATCGNGVLEAGEDCEVNWAPGTTFNSGSTCAGEGFAAGSLACAPGCVYDTSGCRNQVCGDGFVDAPEVCDDGNLVDGDGCDSACGIGVPPTASNSAESVVEDSSVSAVFHMTGSAADGGSCDGTDCKFEVTGCTAGVECPLDATDKTVNLPYGYFDAAPPNRSDFRGLTLTYSDDGTFQVNPRANFYGPVTFKFKTLENGLSSAEATVTITVSGVADPVGTNGCTFFISPAFSAPGSGVTFIGPNFADDTKMAPSTWTGDGPGGVVIKADAFKDWRTGGGKLWFAEAGTGQTPTFRWKKLVTNSWSAGCIGPASVSECFYPDAACVRVSHSVYQMTADLSACKTTVWGKVSVEAWATEDPTWGRNHKIYLETQNSVAVVEFTLAHSITGWLDNAPLTVWFAPPVAP